MKSILAVIVLSLFAVSAFAQGAASRTKRVEPMSNSAKISGFRMGLSYMTLDYKAKGSVGGVSNSISGDFGKGPALYAGYAYLPVQNIGFIGGGEVVFLKYDPSNISPGEDETATLMRIDANAAYAFNQIFYGKAGINVSDLTGDSDNNTEPSFGGQVGLGVRATPSVGFELNYITTNQVSHEDDMRIEVNESGLQLGVTGTF